MTDQTQIIERLHDARDCIATSDVDEGLRDVRRVAGRRRRRNAMVGVAAAGGLLVASVGAVGLLRSGPEQVVVTDTAPAVTADVDDVVGPATSSPAVIPSAPDAGVPASLDPVVAPAAVDPSVGASVVGLALESPLVEVGQPLLDVAGEDFFADWQVPWKGGFLVGRADTGKWNAALSPDGLDWQTLELEPGISTSTPNVVSTGDRLAMLGSRWNDGNVTPIVTSTTNLADWDRHEIQVTRPATELPDIVEVTTWTQRIAVNESGWIATVEHSYRIDSIALAEARSGQTVTGLSESQTDDGIRVLVNPDADGVGGSAVLEVSWAEIEDEIGAELLATIRGPQPPEVWTGTWSGTDPALHDIPTNEPESWISDVVAVDDGFVVVRSVQVLRPDAPARERNELVATLGDGEWTVLDAPIEGDVVSVFPLDGDVAVIVESPDGTIAVHRVDVASETWTPIDVPGLPSTARYVETSGTAALRLDAAPEQRFDTGPTTGTVEQDGLRYTWTFNAPISSYEVVSIESGEILVAESIDIGKIQGSFELAFEHLVGGLGDTVISDPETGAVLMEISADQLEAANPPLSPEPEPEPWIVASADGVRWYVEEAPPAVEGRDSFVMPSVTVSGTHLLLHTASDEWFVVELA